MFLVYYLLGEKVGGLESPPRQHDTGISEKQPGTPNRLVLQQLQHHQI